MFLYYATALLSCVAVSLHGAKFNVQGELSLGQNAADLLNKVLNIYKGDKIQPESISKENERNNQRSPYFPWDENKDVKKYIKESIINKKLPWFDSREHKKHKYNSKESDSSNSREDDNKKHIKIPWQGDEENKKHIVILEDSDDENKKHIVVNPSGGGNGWIKGNIHNRDIQGWAHSMQWKSPQLSSEVNIEGLPNQGYSNKEDTSNKPGFLRQLWNLYRMYREKARSKH